VIKDVFEAAKAAYEKICEQYHEDSVDISMILDSDAFEEEMLKRDYEFEDLVLFDFRESTYYARDIDVLSLELWEHILSESA